MVSMPADDITACSACCRPDQYSVLRTHDTYHMRLCVYDLGEPGTWRPRKRGGWPEMKVTTVLARE